MTKITNITISNNLVKIGTNVKRLRKSKKYSQQDLAFYSNLEKSTISNIERFSLDNITIKTLVKISVILEVELTDLIK